MTQTWAIFYDAYRSLNAKKMFWIVLWLSALVAAAFACVGLNEQGLKILVWQLDSRPLTSENVEPALFYKLIFAQYGIGVWLGWLASILALISTAGIFPDLINGGSIHLLISKPIGRLRLFFTQYAAGLLFVALQVALFTLACFLVIGLRGGAWEPGLFMAVPVVVCFFSYLFSVCVLLGLLTRSTLAALLLTLLFWLLTFGVGLTENVLLAIRTQEKHGNFPPGTVQVYTRDEGRGSTVEGRGGRVGSGEWRVKSKESPDREIPNLKSQIRNPKSPLPRPVPVAEASADDRAAGPPRGGKVPRAVGRALLKAVTEPSAPDRSREGRGERGEGRGESKEAPDRQIPNLKSEIPNPRPPAPGPELKEASVKLKVAYNIIYAFKTVLPKTSETVGILERCLYDMADLPAGILGRPYDQQKAERELMETMRNRPVWWVVGTSLAFEAVVLCGAAWIFWRRDY